MLAEADIDTIADALIEFQCDPLGFVRWAFPWGERGTSLENKTGPEQWQIEHLTRIGEKLADGEELGAIVEEDISAGHGVGKSAVVAWLILWGISTFPDTRGVVTANTDTQLRTKTWAELGKWYQLFIAKDLFRLTATKVGSNDTASDQTWRIDMIPWSKERSEAFAGLHNEGKRILVIFDEASAIDDLIWEVTEGALTDSNTQIIWCRYGNPTRTSGRFHKNCTRPKRNHYARVDSRTVSFTNKAQIQAWIDEYGEDSDFVRVRVKGMFPRAGTTNFIAVETVEEARRRLVPLAAHAGWPLVLSVDPARFGDDSSVVTLRQGLKVLWQKAFDGYDGIDLAGKVREFVVENPKIVAIIYDANGNGADLDSALRRMPDLPTLVPVMWHVPAKDQKKYFNLRAECWGRMKDALKTLDIPDDDALCTELTSLNYGYDIHFRIQLESKKDMKANGGKSPDRADSLALSFMMETVELKTANTAKRDVQPAQAAGWT